MATVRVAEFADPHLFLRVRILQGREVGNKAML